MNRFHVILRLQKLFPDSEIFCSIEKDIIIIRKVMIIAKVDAKFMVPILNDRFLHVDTCRIMLIKAKRKLLKDNIIDLIV